VKQYEETVFLVFDLTVLCGASWKHRADWSRLAFALPLLHLSPSIF
jgi:hypothetical protein